VNGLKTGIFSAIIFILVACSSSSPNTPQTSVPTIGDRIVGIDINRGDNFDSLFQSGISAGMKEVKLSLDWNVIEPVSGTYDNSLLQIVNSYYPAQPTRLSLIIRPINTGSLTLPAGLSGNFDDPNVISAFNNLLTYIHSQLPALNASNKILSIHIGNEIDAYLNTDATRWAQWNAFFSAAKNQVNTLWGNNIKVSSIIQFNTLKDDTKKTLYTTLLPQLDVAAITYYPLASDFTMRPVSDINDDFATMSNAITTKDIYLTECGYSSQLLSNSNETQQAEFITQVFLAWDKYKNSIKLINFTWIEDIGDAQAEIYIDEYGMRGNPNESQFKAYLAGLGLKNFDATNKLAFTQLKKEIANRL
jgi:glycosyl hydrolase family 53